MLLKTERRWPVAAKQVFFHVIWVHYVFRMCSKFISLSCKKEMVCKLQDCRLFITLFCVGSSKIAQARHMLLLMRRDVMRHLLACSSRRKKQTPQSSHGRLWFVCPLSGRFLEHWSFHCFYTGQLDRFQV